MTHAHSAQARLLLGVCVVMLSAAGAPTAQSAGALTPGTRVVLDAHNAYPEHGQWGDRIDRALATGLPVAIEQDLAWYRDPRTGEGRSVLAHNAPYTGTEPSLREHFFERIRPLVEQALRENRRETWPIITLNLDFKTDEPEHHRAIWALLGEYESWLCTAMRMAHRADASPLRPGPVLVLTGEADSQERDFHDAVRPGAALRLFGAVHRTAAGGPEARTNYRRWWNNPWSVVEPQGQTRAGAWTPEDQSRLTAAVRAAHDAGLWVRFYTLDGFEPGQSVHGWSVGYSFGSIDAARIRWKAAIAAGVDFVAVDQYEAFAATLRGAVGIPAADITLEGVLTRDDYERVFERDFQVPPGTERIDVELSYADQQRTVIDLGLRGPSGFRGWSGGSQPRVSVSATSASYGYLPGAVEPGRWSIILGVPNIRAGVSAPYTLRIRFNAAAVRPTLRARAGWYAGDLHAHSGHSDGTTVPPGEARTKVPPSHVFNAARAARLDFVALSDHNTVSHWLDVDRLQPMYSSTLLLHAREVTTYRGHMNAFGERRFLPFSVVPGRSVADLAQAISASGAFTSINHPNRIGGESCMGCRWMDDDAATVGAVQGVEIVNGATVEGDNAGWSFWARMLNAGHRLTAIGASDEHTPDEAEDNRIGRPVTVVYADALSEDAIVAGLARGRVYVRTRGIDGPALEFTAQVDGHTLQMGEQASREASQLTLRVDTAGATGQSVEWVRKGAVAGRASVDSTGRASFVVSDARPGDWFSVVLRDGAGPTVFSNAIWVAR